MRVLDELAHSAKELEQRWPDMTPEALAEGRIAVDRAAAALRDVLDRLEADDAQP